MLNILILVAVVLGIIALSKVVNILEQASTVRGVAPYEVTDRNNKTQARLMLVFLVAYFAFVLYQMIAWGPYLLPVAASEHGEAIDDLMNVTWIIILPVFFITHILLFYFAYKYVYDKNRRAEFYAHNNKLEMLWTAVPATVLLILVLYGMSVWNATMEPLTSDESDVEIEIYARQFDWTARYPGEDGKFGNSNIRNISGINFLGLDSTDKNAWDDKYVKAEFLIPVNKAVQFYFRSQDVIHSAYMPHFRAQMNCVPGMVTRFNFVPTKTTEEMRKITGNPEFHYQLLCNKICGAAHYNMGMDIIVVSEEEYESWLKEQKVFLPIEGRASIKNKEENQGESDTEGQLSQL